MIHLDETIQTPELFEPHTTTTTAAATTTTTTTTTTTNNNNNNLILVYFHANLKAQKPITKLAQACRKKQ
jgi:hypothetical protein